MRAMRRWFLRVVVVVALAQAAASGDNGSGASAAGTDSTAKSSAPAMNDDMRQILRKVGSIPCSESVRARMYALLYDSNRALHDQCYRDCGYQFFPLSQDKATPEQIVGAATSCAYMTLFSGVYLAGFPECDVDFVSPRSCAEILLRIKKDIDDKKAPPTQSQFYEFYNLNGVVNLVNENASLIEDAFRNSSTSITLWEMTKMMNRIYVSPDVLLADDMTIMVRGETTPTATTRPWKHANVALTAGASSAGKSSDDSSGSSGFMWVEEAAPTTASARGRNESGAAPALTPTPSAVRETTRSSGSADSPRATRGLFSLAVVVATVVAACLSIDV